MIFKKEKDIENVIAARIMEMEPSSEIQRQFPIGFQQKTRRSGAKYSAMLGRVDILVTCEDGSRDIIEVKKFKNHVDLVAGAAQVLYYAANLRVKSVDRIWLASDCIPDSLAVFISRAFPSVRLMRVDHE